MRRAVSTLRSMLSPGSPVIICNIRRKPAAFIMREAFSTSCAVCPRPARAQHLLAHGLRAELHRLNAVFGKALQHSTVYGVRPRGKADGVDIAAVEMRLCRGERAVCSCMGMAVKLPP